MKPTPVIHAAVLSKHYQVPVRTAGLQAAGRWPVTIYPNWLRYGLTFLVPVAFAVTVPAQALTDRLSPRTLLAAAALTLFLLVISRMVWRIGMRSYAGASA